DRFAMAASQSTAIGVVKNEASEAGIVTFPAHYDAPVRQLFDRAHGEPSAPIEKLPLLVAKRLPHSRRVIDNAAVEREVLAASDDLERIELQILYRAHRAFSAALALPSAAGPQALSAENESASRDARERDHWHKERCGTLSPMAVVFQRKEEIDLFWVAIAVEILAGC